MKLLTVNLYDSLVKSKRETLEEKDLAEFNTQIEEVLNTTDSKYVRDGLEEMGFSRKVSTMHSVELKNNIKKQFGKDHVFSYSEIRDLAEKYQLRFLHTSAYKGKIDAEAIRKAAQAKEKYGLHFYDRDFYIMAPKESFELRERPVDPLLFYKVGEESYLLIHKWGNDLSVFRAIYPFCFKYAWPVAIGVFLVFLGFAQFIVLNLTDSPVPLYAREFIAALGCALATGASMGLGGWLTCLDTGRWNDDFRENRW